MNSISFTVLGTPQPQGSAKGFVYRDKATGKHRAAITSDNAKLRPWRQDVAWAAKEAMAKLFGPIEPQATDQAVFVHAQFFFARPKSLPKKAVAKITKPDIDKLLRALLDALTGIVFKDDAQVTVTQCRKAFDPIPHCAVEIKWEIDFNND